MNKWNFRIAIQLVLLVVLPTIVFFNSDSQLAKSRSWSFSNASLTLKVDQKSIKSTPGKILILTAAIGNTWYKPIAKANRENYCKRHGYELLFAESINLERDLHVNWAKIVIAMDFLNQTRSGDFDWILFADLDLFVMDLDMKLEKVVKLATANEYVKKLERERDPNKVDLESVAEKVSVLVASDGNGINFGSVLMRVDNFTRQLLNKMYENRHVNSIMNKNIWHEQAVFIHLTKTWPELHERLVHVSQKAINAYPGNGPPHYRYVKGDFIIHFPGGEKHHLKPFLPSLFEAQPELKVINDERLNDCANGTKKYCE